MSKKQLFLYLLATVWFCYSCRDDPSFDRSLFLKNYADSLILPAVSEVAETAATLHRSVISLRENPNPKTLSQAQYDWDKTYQAWIRVSGLNFGPGGSKGRKRTIVEEVGAWPVDQEGIEQKISTSNFQLSDAKRNTRGLPAVEYLLYHDQPTGILTSSASEDRLNYLVKIVEHLAVTLDKFHDDWKSNYKMQFVESDGTDVKSSVTLLFNEMVRDFETMRDLKLGIPAGLIAGQSGPQPELSEARFSKKSLTYLVSNYNHFVSFWYGTTEDGQNGLGWEEYLLSVEGGPHLVKKIREKFNEIDLIIKRIPSDKTMEELALANHPALAAFYAELKKLTPYVKGESSSLLSLAITFSSGDGD
ncbi:MAG: imelysin family protein [Bacteroidota bacterium]